MIPDKKQREIDNDNIRRLSNREKLHNITLKQSSKRRLINKLVTIFAISSVIIAIIPLGSILIEVVRNGISVISIEFLTKPPGSFYLGNGGIAPAIQGTLIVVGLASLIGAPIGVLSGIYLSEFALLLIVVVVAALAVRKYYSLMLLDYLMMFLLACHQL